MYLLDTNVVSELRRTRPHGAVLSWIADITPDRLFISAVTAGEIQVGIEITRAQDPTKAREFELWLESVIESYGVLDMDTTVFREWARLQYGKSATLMLDAMIAATAIVHGLTVATRNIRDFQVFQVALVDPFQAS